MKIPKVFVSYSHDSLDHKKWVLELATRLRQNGVDATLDQWDLTAGDDVPHFMESNLAKADYILMICTSKYVEKANAGSGGVGYEKMIITSSLMKSISESKIIPVIRQSGTTEVPTFLKSKLYINYSKDDDYEYASDELLRKIHDAPLFKKPEIGYKPFSPVAVGSKTPQHDTLMEVMRVMIQIFEHGQREFVVYSEVRSMIPGMSRTMIDVALDQAKSEKLISFTGVSEAIWITPLGKKYALDNKLV